MALDLAYILELDSEIYIDGEELNNQHIEIKKSIELNSICIK